MGFLNTPTAQSEQKPSAKRKVGVALCLLTRVVGSLGGEGGRGSMRKSRKEGGAKREEGKLIQV